MALRSLTFGAATALALTLGSGFLLSVSQLNAYQHPMAAAGMLQPTHAAVRGQKLVDPGHFLRHHDPADLSIPVSSL